MKMMRDVATEVDDAVVSATPVDTGRARSNWVVQIGSAWTGTRLPHVPGLHGSTGPANVQASLNQGRAVIAGYRVGNIHISNNLPYIGELNQGSSRQAPANYVQTAVLAAVNVLTQVRLLP